jgi:hypothetical protein
MASQEGSGMQGTLLGGRYELAEAIGVGAMGTVYQATDGARVAWSR